MQLVYHGSPARADPRGGILGGPIGRSLFALAVLIAAAACIYGASRQPHIWRSWAVAWVGEG